MPDSAAGRGFPRAETDYGMASPETASGIPYSIDWLRYTEKCSKAGLMRTIGIKVEAQGYGVDGSLAFPNMNLFRSEILGYTTTDDVNPGRLKRHLPLQWPGTEVGECHCLSLEAVSFGNAPTGPNVDGFGVFVDEELDSGEWPVSWGHVIFRAEFGPLPFVRFLDDEDAYTSPNIGELERYVRHEEVMTGREMRHPDYGVEVQEADATWSKTSQVGFVPVVEGEVTYTWYEVPYPDSVPVTAIAASLGKVNDAEFDNHSGFDANYKAETLLFYKTSPLDDWYWKNGAKYVDIKFMFRTRQWGWNEAKRRDGTIGATRKVVTATPLTTADVYESANMKNLFVSET